MCSAVVANLSEIRLFPLLTELENCAMTEKKYKYLTVLDILLPIQEPVGNLVLTRVLHNGDDFLDLLFAQLTSTLVKINVSLEFQIKMSTNHRIICHVFFYNRKMTEE
jgi:hypothetical protein